MNRALAEAIADPLRAVVLDALCEEVATASQIADRLGKKRNQVAFQVDVLALLGCLSVVEQSTTDSFEYAYMATPAIAAEHRSAIVGLGFASTGLDEAL